MNHAYRHVWNAVHGRYVPAPETAKGAGKHTGHSLLRSAAVVLLGNSLFSMGALAGPTGGMVSAGSGSISQSGTGTTTIVQSSQNLTINWASFSTAVGESVNFVQPNSNAIVLNRIIGTQSSMLNGSLSANGQVWILNPNGVLFGSTASVNVGGLVASTLALNDADFLAGKRSFAGDGAQGAVVNQGSLTGGYVALIGKQVSNTGTITTANGTAALVAGNKVTLDFSGNHLLGVQVDEGTLNALAENKGLIRANNGTVMLTASAKDALLGTVVNNEGVIEARGIDGSGGRILLLGAMNGGTVKVGGTLDASANNGYAGGSIETSGAHVQVADGAKISTLSDTGKTGTWLIDPTDFTISAGSGAQTSSGMGATTLANNLSSSNVTLATNNSTGTDSGDIHVNAAVSWSANTTLTLNAFNNINVNAAITATGTSAGLALNYGGDYKVAAPITLSGASATLALNGTAYTLIHSMAQMASINTTGLSGRYALAQDLDASGTTYTSAVVGYNSHNFTGTFAGLGHVVSNLTISASSTDNVGLFFRNDGTFRDIGLVGGSVSGQDRVGGLVGQNFGAISAAYATGSVSGRDSVGGLVGYNSSSISVAYATGNVSGRDVVGGLVGANTHGSVSNAYATGNVSGSSYVGGLVGANGFASISNAYATGSVVGSSNVGGLVGDNNAGSTISNAYWDSTTTGISSAIGNNNGTSTNVNAVTSSTAYQHSSYANLGTWTETASGSGVWVAKDGSNNPQWVIVEGSTRPFLYSEYSTSVRNAHQLQLMAYNLGANYTLSGNIDASETSGSNASGMWTTSGFSPVGNGTRTFDGSLEGQGHTIANLSIRRHSINYVGLFGQTGSASIIRNLGVVGGSVFGNNFVGGVVGKNYGLISGTYLDGSVSGDGGTVGGLVGDNAGVIVNTYAAGSVSGGTYSAGGLVGVNEGTISNAYATANVSGGWFVGGLIGTNFTGSINNAYATGTVSGSLSLGALLGLNNDGSVANSFWLTSISTTGIGTRQNGNVDSLTRGLSASEASSASTYIAAGWDVATAGGSSSVWRSYDGSAMPLLRSFLTSLTITTGNTSKVFDGTTTLRDSYTLSDGNANTGLILGSASYNTDRKVVGRYTIRTNGLYSTQQGYDISYVNGTANITNGTDLTVAQQSLQATQPSTTSAVALADIVTANSRALDVESCGMRLPAGVACQ